MAYGFARMFGLINVEEKNDNVFVTGIPADVMARDISKAWRTSRINTYMFSQMGQNHFAFPKFFAIEVAYILNDMLTQVERQTAKSTLRKILRLLMENTWLRDTQTPPAEPLLDFKYLSRLRWQPKPHQEDFLNSYSVGVPQLHLNGYLLASPPGTGKTFMDIAAAVCLGEKAVVKIIMSPKNALRLVWAKTISDLEATAFKTPPTAWYSDEAGEAPINVEFCVFHYEALDRALALGRKLSQAGIPFVVIVDESHNFNEVSAQRTLDLMTLCRLPTAHNHIWASGSPIKALGTEAIPLLRSIDPLFTDDVMSRFKKIFGGSAERALEILQNRLSKVMFKVPKEAVISDKPIVVQHYIKMPNSERFTTEAVREEMRRFIDTRMQYYQKTMKDHRALFEQCLDTYEKSIRNNIAAQREFKVYQKYIKEISSGYDPRAHGEMVKYCRHFEKTRIIPNLPASLRKQFKDSQSVVKYVSLKVQGEALGTILAKRRAECASALAIHCDLEKIITDAAAKTVVFTSFVSTVKDATDYLKVKGFDARPVYADTNSQLVDIVKTFGDDPTVNPLCATFKSLSTAVPLIMANTIVMLDKPVRQYLWEQTVARAARIGQTEQVYVHEIFLDTGSAGNVSTRAEEIISWSRDQVASIIGEEFSGNDLQVVVEHFSEDTDAALVKRATLRPVHHTALTWSVEHLKSFFRRS